MRIIVVLLLSLTLNTVSALPQPLKFFHITHEQGLSQSTVNSILKDSEGFFWFCTNDGLNKWNGYDFEYYFHDPDNPNSIGLGRINTIIEDSKGVLWIGTNEGGLCKYVRELDHFENYPLENVSNINLEYNNVTSIISLGNQLLIGTFNKGLLLFDINSETYLPVSLEVLNGINIQDQIDIKLFIDSDSTIWIGSSKGIFKTQKIVTDADKLILRGAAYFFDIAVINIYEDSRGFIWLGTYQDGAYKCDKEMLDFYHLKAGKENGKNINHPIVRSFAEDSIGNLWVGTGGGGINIYNYQTKEITYHTPKLGNKYSISSNIIYYLYADSEKNLWVGTYNGGVSYTNWYKQGFNHVRSFGAIGDINNNAILSFCEIEKGKFWIGTDGGGINVFNRNTNIHTPLKIPGKYLPKVVTALVADSKGNVYIGTYREGLFVYNINTGYYKHFTENEINSINTNDIWGLALSKDESVVWIATLGGGLNKFVPSKNEFQYFIFKNNTANTISENYISVVLVDSEDNLWLGTLHRGLSYMPKNEEGVFYTFRKENSDLASNEVRSVFEDSENRILVGNQDGGLSVFDSDKQQFTVYDRSHGLPNNTVVGILEDNTGNLWLSTNKGISKVRFIGKDSIQTRNYRAIDGLQANEFNPNACLKSTDGVLFFGGVNGYNAFDPLEIIDARVAGEVILTGMHVFDKELLPGKKGSVLESSVRYTRKVNLNHKQSTITFEYAMLDYVVPELNTYEYRLIGLDEGWTHAGTLRRASYTNLDPGTYHFEVKGVNSQGIKASKTVSLEVFIKPPFYQTWLFRVLVFLGMILLLLAIYRFRLRSLRIKGEMLKVMVEDRTKELRSVNQVLEKRNKEIFEQSEVLLEQQTKNLVSKKEIEKSYKKIELQNIELENHRHNLEDIVQERTVELEKAKLKAEESEQLKMAFLSNMSHEIRTPMNAIVGFASLLGDEDITDDEKDEYIRQVNRNSDSLLLLIDDILDLSKIEANQLLVKRSVFELNNFINEVYFNWQHIEQKDNSNVKLKFSNSLDSMQVFVNSDELRLRQILNNLLDNAFKFTDKGEIEIGLYKEDERLIFYVRDTGIGIPTDHINQIFNRFRKGEETGKKLYRGAGLGLAISNKLAHLLDGELWVESKLNRGATFYLSIPIDEMTEAEQKIEVRQYKDTSDVDFTGLKVLIAEDEEANYYYLEGVLNRKGIKVEWAQDGDEAFKKVSVNQYDLVLMDIKMPVMDGIEATKKIKSMFPKQLVVAQTAYARPEEESKFRLVGFDDYIAKPIKNNVLTCLLEKHLSSFKSDS